MSHHANLAGHPGGRRLKKILRRYFYWLNVALDCCEVANNYVDCVREGVNLRKNAKKMKLFTPKAPLYYVSIDILGKLIASKCGNRYLLIVRDRYSKLECTDPLKWITAA